MLSGLKVKDEAGRYRCPSRQSPDDAPNRDPLQSLNGVREREALVRIRNDDLETLGGVIDDREVGGARTLRTNEPWAARVSPPRKIPAMSA